jgi:hypothetical protein
MQVTLEGTEADDEDIPVRVWCADCDEWHLTEDPYNHDHELYQSPDEINAFAEEEDEEDEPEKVGEMFRVELSYSMTYTFKVPAWSEHQAKERAKDLRLVSGVSPSDMFLVHSDTSSLTELYEDNDRVPDDYDPYGSEPLWSVYGEGGEEA